MGLQVHTWLFANLVFTRIKKDENYSVLIDLC